MRRTVIAGGSLSIGKFETMNDQLKSKRNMSERNKAAEALSRQTNHSQNQGQHRSNPMKKPIFYTILLTLMFSGCAVAPPTQTGPIMIPGRMFNLNDGTEFALAIEYRFDNGIMTARNLKTGEEFNGNYTAIFEDGEVSKGTYSNAWVGNVGSVTTTARATRGTGKGILRGDKGTVISVTMEIKPTYNRNIYPTGFGEGTDNNGTHYQLQFAGR